MKKRRILTNNCQCVSPIIVFNSPLRAFNPGDLLTIKKSLTANLTGDYKIISVGKKYRESKNGSVSDGTPLCYQSNIAIPAATKFVPVHLKLSYHRFNQLAPLMRKLEVFYQPHTI